MKKIIYLKTEYLDLKDKKISKAEELNLLQKIFLSSLSEFKKDIKPFSDDYEVKIIKNYFPDPEVLIEYPDKFAEEVYNKLINIAIIDIIDSALREE